MMCPVKSDFFDNIPFPFCIPNEIEKEMDGEEKSTINQTDIHGLGIVGQWDRRELASVYPSGSALSPLKAFLEDSLFLDNLPHPIALPLFIQVMLLSNLTEHCSPDKPKKLPSNSSCRHLAACALKYQTQILPV
jgi:hypothetical protein